MATILMTGFEPFGGERLNPSWEAVDCLPERVGGARLLKARIPTAFRSSAERLTALLAGECPDAVICVGQAAGRSGLSVERVAVNLMDARIPDNAGERPVDVPVRADGPAAYFATLPVRRIVEALRGAGFPAELSCTAGTFVCNALFYTLMDWAARHRPDMPGGFIHVPLLPEQAAARGGQMPDLALERIVRGLELAAATTADLLR